MAVFWLPIELLYSDCKPNAELFVPIVFCFNAVAPNLVFELNRPPPIPISIPFTVMSFVKLAESKSAFKPILLLNVAVSALFNFISILFDKVEVSTLLNLTSILLDKLVVSNVLEAN